MTAPVDPSVLALLGPARPLSSPMPGAEASGEAVVEEVRAWHDLVLDVRHTPLSLSGLEGLLEPGEEQRHIDGGVTVLRRLTPPGARVPGRRRPQVDLPFLALGSALVGCALALGLFLTTAPPPPSTVIAVPEPMRALVLLPPPATPEPPPRRAERADPGAPAAAAARPSGERRREPDAPRRRLDREVVAEAGVLGVLQDRGALGGVFEAGLGEALGESIGRLSATKGSLTGSGLGARGPGPGGGGLDRIGSIDGVGTRGRGSGQDLGEGGGLGPKRVGELRTSPDFLSVGGLDPALIDQVVKRQLETFRFCYQRELSRSPELAGKVTVQFVIAPDGSVSRSSVKSSSLGSAAVESCLADRMRRLSFPAPRGGGIVMVSYPFIFSPG